MLCLFSKTAIFAGNYILNDMESTVISTPLNIAQIELIQLFEHELDSHELSALRKLLIDFRFRLVEERAERITKAKSWNKSDIDDISKGHQRSLYKAKNFADNREVK
jgi:hypothetical protein